MQDERMAANVLCVGQPLKTLSDAKVSLLPPDKRRARGPRGKVPVGDQTGSKQKACGLPLPPQSVYLVMLQFSIAVKQIISNFMA